MKKIILILAGMIAMAVTTDAQKCFKIVDATYMTYAGGMPQSGSGQVYSLTIVVQTNDKVTFPEIWIGASTYGQPQVVSRKPNNEYKKGDTVYVSYTIHHYPPGSPLEQNLPKTEYKPAPIKIDGEALIGFTIGKTIRYRSIKAFRTLPAQNYP